MSNRVFPQHIGVATHPGLSKRELFAAMMMQAMVSSVKYDGVSTDYAQIAIKAADALIAELEKKK